MGGYIPALHHPPRHRIYIRHQCRSSTRMTAVCWTLSRILTQTNAHIEGSSSQSGVAMYDDGKRPVQCTALSQSIEEMSNLGTGSSPSRVANARQDSHACQCPTL